MSWASLGASWGVLGAAGKLLQPSCGKALCSKRLRRTHGRIDTEPPVLEPARCRTARSETWPRQNFPGAWCSFFAKNTTHTLLDDMCFCTLSNCDYVQLIGIRATKRQKLELDSMRELQQERMLHSDQDLGWSQAKAGLPALFVL